MKGKVAQVTLILSLVGLLSIMSCSESSDPIDTTAPTVELMDPIYGESMEAGGYAFLEARLTDDIELATYNLEIHENFDGHTHGRIAATSDDPSLLKWSFSQSFEVPAGNTEYLAKHDDIEIPSNAMAGPYHYIVQAIDASGNSTSFQDGSAIEIVIYITNDSQPVINITNMEDDELEIEVGVVFMVKGEVTDPTTGEYAGMHGMDIILGEGLEDHEDHSHGRIASEELIEEEFEEEDLEKFMVDGAIILDKVFEEIGFTLSDDQLNELIDEEIDHLLLTIRVHDEQGNIAVSNTDVHIHMD